VVNHPLVGGFADVSCSVRSEEDVVMTIVFQHYASEVRSVDTVYEAKRTRAIDHFSAGEREQWNADFFVVVIIVICYVWAVNPVSNG